MYRVKPQWYLYIIRCKNESLYTGITIDVDRRFAEHCAQGAKCARYLRGKAPLELEFVMLVGDKRAAYRLEYAVKRLSKLEKERIVSGLVKLII